MSPIFHIFVSDVIKGARRQGKIFWDGKVLLRSSASC